MALILELRHPDGTHTRRRLDGATLVLGRALSSDIVLDDPYVDARHARIGLDDFGALVIEDLGSVNGVISDEKGLQATLRLHAGTSVRIGRTTLRIRDEDEPVPPALVDEQIPPLLRPVVPVAPVGLPRPAHAPRWTTRVSQWSETNHGRLMISGAAIVIVGIYSWLSSYEQSTAAEVLGGAFAFAVLAAIWAGIWAIASRVSTQRFNFVGHFAIVSAVAIAGIVTVVLDEWYSFLVPQSALSGLLAGVVALALLAAMIAWHLSLSSRMSRDRRLRAGILVSVSLVAMGSLFALVEGETFSDVPTFSGVVKPVAAGWLPTATVDDFGTVIAELKDEVDELAAPPQR